jgi:hypothetical protein
LLEIARDRVEQQRRGCGAATPAAGHAASPTIPALHDPEPLIAALAGDGLDGATKGHLSAVVARKA